MGAACAKCSACYEAFWTHIENGDFERWVRHRESAGPACHLCAAQSALLTRARGLRCVCQAHFLGILTSVLLVAVPILKVCMRPPFCRPRALVLFLFCIPPEIAPMTAMFRTPFWLGTCI